jgi:Spy/CpxP family protein refolding chaperone
VKRTDAAAESSPDKPSTVSKPPTFPDIPLSLFTSSTTLNFGGFGGANLDAINLTPDQKRQISALVSSNQTETNRIQRLIAHADTNHFISRRFKVVAERMTNQRSLRTQTEINAILTETQRATLRQRHRSALVERNSPKEITDRPTYVTEFIEKRSKTQALDQSDLLDLLEQPATQQSLEITDEQWLRIEAVRRKAYEDVQSILEKQYRDVGQSMIVRSGPNPNEVLKQEARPMIARLHQDTLALLTPRTGHEVRSSH